MDKQELRSYLTHASQGLRIQHHVGGSLAGTANSEMVSQFLTAWVFLAADVLSQSEVNDTSMIGRIQNFIDALNELDIINILGICQDAADLLIKDSVSTYSSFKGCIYEMHPVPMESVGRLLAPVSPLLVSVFLCPDVKAVSLQPILNFLRFGKKLNFDAIGLEEKALTAYLDTENRLLSVFIDPKDPLISGLNQIMRCWLRDIDLRDLVPTHGNGSVAEGRLTCTKSIRD